MRRLLAAAALALAVPAAVAAQSGAVPFLPGAVSGPKNDYNLSLSEDERTLVFARSEADFAKAKIMIAERGADSGSGFPDPRPIGFSDDRYRDSDPWLTPDGRALYFVSDRPTATRPDKRDLDIWRSVKRRGRWQAPEHLGDVVNGPGEELGPELHDGTLYFATARRSGAGGLDVYAADLGPNGFGAPRLLAAPINSAESESDFTLSSDGRTAMFWRGSGGEGRIHLTRRTRDGGWSEPLALPESVNLGAFNFTPAFGQNGRTVLFASDAARSGQPLGMADVFEAKLPPR